MIPPHILYVEDFQDTSLLMKLLLRKEGFEVTHVPTIKQAWELAQEKQYDLFLLDYVFKDDNGLSLCRSFRTRFPHTPIIIYTCHGGEENRAAGLDAGADSYFTKPQDPLVIINHPKSLLQNRPRQL